MSSFMKTWLKLRDGASGFSVNPPLDCVDSTSWPRSSTTSEISVVDEVSRIDRIKTIAKKAEESGWESLTEEERGEMIMASVASKMPSRGIPATVLQVERTVMPLGRIQMVVRVEIDRMGLLLVHPGTIVMISEVNNDFGQEIVQR